MDADRLELFEANRRRLFGLAYLLGDATEAEDVVQDAFLRWTSSNDVVVPEAWLTTVVTNLCVKRLTSARARRESYVGPWIRAGGRPHVAYISIVGVDRSSTITRSRGSDPAGPSSSADGETL